MSWQSSRYFITDATFGEVTIYLRSDRGAFANNNLSIDLPLVPAAEFGGPAEWRKMGEWLIAQADAYEEGAV